MRARLRRWLDLIVGPVSLPGGTFLAHHTDRPTFLAALKDAAAYRNDEYVNCKDCINRGPCGDHRKDLAAARRYEDLYARLLRGRRSAF